MLPPHRNFYLYVCLWLLLGSYRVAYSHYVNDTVALVTASAQEMELAYDLNHFRVLNQLPALPISNRLVLVADLHAKNLQSYFDTSSNCSLHSWYGSGNWKNCCHKKAAPNQACMSAKPREIAEYPGKGYELVYYTPGVATNQDAFAAWQELPAASDMILCKGKWRNFRWEMIGVAVSGHYAIAWFGDMFEKPNEPLAAISDGNVKPVENIVKADTSAHESSKSYYVIVASLPDEANAQSTFKRLSANGIDNLTIHHTGQRFRIAAGKFASAEEAVARKARIKNNIPDAWILVE